MSKRMWLIDAGYLMKGQSSVYRGYIFDYLKLRQKIEEDGDIWRAYYLNSTPNPPSDGQNNFHNWMRSAAGPKIITKLYDLKEFPVDEAYCKQCGQSVAMSCPNDSGHPLSKIQQKGVDVGLATLALIHANQYDTLILSSGDSDLLDAIEHITELGKRFELAVFNVGVSTELQSRADKVYWINEFADEVKRD